MRMSSFQDCLKVLAHFRVDPSKGTAIDIGGTKEVWLKHGKTSGVRRNPILEVNPQTVFLDSGFNVDLFNTDTDNRIDFLDRSAIENMQESFDMVFCFDTLEHVSNPFKFCENLVYIAKPGGSIYVATVFSYAYHPSPEDYFRFSPTGLRQCFIDPANRLANEITVAWSGWESDGMGVAALVFKGRDRERELDKDFELEKKPQKEPGLKDIILDRGIRAARRLKHGWKS